MRRPHLDSQQRLRLACSLVIAAGLVMLSDRIGISGIHLSGRYWPFLLVAFGLVRWLDPPRHRNGRRRSRWSGAWLVYIGLWGFVRNLIEFK